jgi:hypothetical protein
MPNQTGNGKEELDIFIANTVYPNAESIFTARIQPLSEIKDKAFVVLDTNVLLIPYRTGSKSLAQIRQTYENLAASGQLVIPGQVAREFARNRASKLSELFQQLSKKRAIPGLQKGKYLLLESLDEYQEVLCLEKEIDGKTREYKAAIGRVLDRIREWTWDDPVSLVYADLFTKDVVLDPKVDLQKAQEDLRRRQLHKIPPGYKDSSKDDQGIGDLLIWYTILDIGTSKKRSVIFVSGEEKADWWHKSERQNLYPRYELVDEFHRSSDGHSFHIIPFSRLLELYGASESTVQEVREEEHEHTIEHRLIGEFTQKWQVLESHLLSLYRDHHPSDSTRWRSVSFIATSLQKEQLISDDDAALLRELNHFRNLLVHEILDLSVPELQSWIARLDSVLV